MFRCGHPDVPVGGRKITLRRLTPRDNPPKNSHVYTSRAPNCLHKRQVERAVPAMPPPFETCTGGRAVRAQLKQRGCVREASEPRRVRAVPRVGRGRPLARGGWGREALLPLRERKKAIVVVPVTGIGNSRNSVPSVPFRFRSRDS